MFWDDFDFDTEDLLYDTFRKLEKLGQGGMGRILKVKADPKASGYRKFLASAVAWQEIGEHSEVMPYRLRVLGTNHEIGSLHEEESEQMHNGMHEAARGLRKRIKKLSSDLARQIAELKKRQEYFLKVRRNELNRKDPAYLISRMNKIGLPYPEDGIFALKQILLDDAVHKKRFQDEFTSLKLAQHKNILTVYDSGDDYYVMEFIENVVAPGSLAPALDTAAQLYTNEQRLQVIIKTAQAVEHAHLFGVVHRDIKPDNIAVTIDGNVKLIDFGLVKSLETESKTVTGAIMGTPMYMSPEQIRNSKNVGPGFDIYALGATLYYYVTGFVPNKKMKNTETDEIETPEELIEIFSKVCDDKYTVVPPSEVAPGLPAALEEIILKSMEKNRTLRYQTIREFREDLETYVRLAGSGVLQAGSFFDPQACEIDSIVKRRKDVLVKRRPGINTLIIRSAPYTKRAAFIGICLAVVIVLSLVVIELDLIGRIRNGFRAMFGLDTVLKEKAGQRKTEVDKIIDEMYQEIKPGQTKTQDENTDDSQETQEILSDISDIVNPEKMKPGQGSGPSAKHITAEQISLADKIAPGAIEEFLSHMMDHDYSDAEDLADTYSSGASGAAVQGVFAYLGNMTGSAAALDSMFANKLQKYTGKELGIWKKPYGNIYGKLLQTNRSSIMLQQHTYTMESCSVKEVEIPFSDICTATKYSILETEFSKNQNTVLTLYLEAVHEGDKDIQGKLNRLLQGHVLYPYISSMEGEKPILKEMFEPAASAAAEGGITAMVPGETLKDSGWKHDSDFRRFSPEFRVHNSSLVKPGSQKPSRLFRYILFSGGEILFTFSMHGALWRVELLEVPFSANYGLINIDGMFSGEHRCRIIVKEKNIRCYIDGKRIHISRQLTRKLDGRSCLRITCRGDTRVKISDMVLIND